MIASGTQTAGAIPVSVTIAPSGSFNVTIPTATAVLTPNTGNTLATGNLGTITVSDSRNSFPGYAVYGQETSNFVGSGLPAGVTVTSIPSDNLGWAPTGTVQGGATLGPSAADIGLTAGPSVLVQALAGSGFGTDTLNPALTLTLPAGTPTGTFTGARDEHLHRARPVTRGDGSALLVTAPGPDSLAGPGAAPVPRHPRHDSFFAPSARRAA